MIASICAMSDCMPSRASVDRLAISSSSCMRVSGVRRSCEMPARISARSDSTCCRSSTIWLKLRLASMISLRAFFRQRLGTLALGDGARGGGQARQRQVDQARNERGAEQRQHADHAGPAEPLHAGQAVEPFALEHQPVGVAVDLEADPEAGDAVDAARKARVGAQLVLDDRFDLRHQRIVRRRVDHVGGHQRDDADAFVADQVEQQFAAQVDRRVGQRGARDGDDRDHQFGGLLDLRAALDGVDHADPRRHRQRGQEPEQQEGAPEQAALEPAQAAARRRRCRLTGKH